jgi:sigma-B regulation protein RsbU (phosphoserine phosphatase)
LCDHAEVRKYATLFFGTIDRDGNLEYVNGGHPSPFVMRRGGEVQDLFTEGSLPVGLIPGAEYAVSRFALEPGDTLVLFSDGITEAENRNHELFGEERFRNVLDGQHENSLDRLEKNIVNSVESFAAGTSQGDDITVMLVRYRGSQ